MPTQAPTGIDVFVFRHDGDLGTLAGFAGNRADDHRVVVNLRHFRLEQMRHQFRHGARHHNLRSFGSLLNANDHHSRTLAGSERFQPRLVLPGHSRLGLAQIHDDVLAFLALDGGVDDFTDAADVLVVNRVPLGLAHLLEDDLLRQLRRNAPQYVRGLVGAQLAADLGGRINALWPLPA